MHQIGNDVVFFWGVIGSDPKKHPFNGPGGVFLTVRLPGGFSSWKNATFREAQLEKSTSSTDFG